MDVANRDESLDRGLKVSVLRVGRLSASRKANVERELEVRFRDDRMGYTEAKTDFVIAASRP